MNFSRRAQKHFTKSSIIQKLFLPHRLIYVIPIIASVFGPFSGRSRFWVNDDVGNWLVLSGGYSGKIDFRVYVLGPITGFIISSLYQFTTALPWYPIILIALPLVNSLLLLRDLRRFVPTFVLLGFSSFLASSMLLIGGMLNYTFSSFVSCGLAIAILMIRIDIKKTRFRTLLTPLILITVSLGLRTSWPADIYILPPAFTFASILALFVFILIRRSAKNFLLLIGSLASIFVVTLIPQYVVLKFDQDWSEYIEYSAARGALNGTKTFDSAYNEAKANINYMDQLTSKTGIDSFGLDELNDWHLYDVSSVSTKDLVELQKLALEEYQEINSPLYKILLVLKESLNFLSFQPYAICFLLAILVLSFDHSKNKFSKRLFIQCLFIILLSALIFGVTLSSTRAPNYVVAGCLFVVALLLLMLIAFEAKSFKSAIENNLLVKIVFVSILTFGSCQTFSSFLDNPSSQKLLIQAEARARILESSNFSIPVIDDVMDVGTAYGSSPFDTSIPEEFLASKNFSGGTFVRSPQSVDRWNYLTKGRENFESLFSSNIYERVLLRSRFAEAISGEILKHRGKCLTKVSTEYEGFVTLRPRPLVLCRLRVTQLSTGRSVTDVFSSVNGFNLEVTSQAINKIEISLISPFGEFAKIHDARVNFYEAITGTYSTQVVSVDPMNKSRILFHNLQVGDRIEIISLSKCVIPFEIDPIRFPDRSEKCIGIGQLIVDNERIFGGDLIG